MIKTKCLCGCEEICAKIESDLAEKANVKQALQGEKGEAGVGIVDAMLTDDYRLVLTFSDGSQWGSPIPIRGRDGQAGPRGAGITGTQWNPDGTITYTYEDGSTFTTPYLKGEPGETGPRGERGQTGNGIARAYLDSQYKIHLEYTDGSEWVSAESVRGPQGIQGQEGQKGETGDTGNGISSATLNPDYTLTIRYTNGNSWTTPFPIRGEKGDTGSEGPRGKEGPAGERGPEGPEGPAGSITEEQKQQINYAVTTVDEVKAKVDELELFKFPNATIIGAPLIEEGNVSRFSATDYMVFPFIVDSKNYPFTISMCFTTSSDVTTQQNILDSYFGMALAIQNGRGIMALSSNGTSWDIGLVTGAVAIAPNKTYYAKVSWDGSAYRTALSEDGINYVNDMYAATSIGLHPTTMYIGASPNIFGAGSAHPFKGTINLNKCSLVVAGLDVWQGMDDAGLSTRADLSLSNLDADGEKRFSERYTKTEADGIFARKDELPTVPTNVSAFANDADYATESFVSDEFARQLALLDGNGVAY